MNPLIVDPVTGVTVSARKFLHGFYRATRKPNEIWSGWIGPFPSETEALDLTRSPRGSQNETPTPQHLAPGLLFSRR